MHLQSGQLDKALRFLKQMEAEITASLPAHEQQELLPVAYSNLAHFYYRKGKFASCA